MQEDRFLELLDASDVTAATMEELYKAADLMVNSFSFNPEKLTEEIVDDVHRRAVMEMIAVHFIRFWGEEAEEWLVDARNEKAVEYCKKISETQEFKSICSNLKNEEAGAIASEFVHKTRQMHRTLMQSFAGFIFCFIAHCDGDWKTISDKMPSEWYKLPFI